MELTFMQIFFLLLVYFLMFTFALYFVSEAVFVILKIKRMLGR